MVQRTEALEVYFYSTNSGNEPVREWLKDLPKEDRRVVGFDIKTVQYGYPIGMPLTRVLHGTNGLEEIRCNLSNGIARIIFCVEDNIFVDGMTDSICLLLVRDHLVTDTPCLCHRIHMLQLRLTVNCKIDQ